MSEMKQLKKQLAEANAQLKEARAEVEEERLLKRAAIKAGLNQANEIQRLRELIEQLDPTGLLRKTITQAALNKERTEGGG